MCAPGNSGDVCICECVCMHVYMCGIENVQCQVLRLSGAVVGLLTEAFPKRSFVHIKRDVSH